jgi:regulator of sigma E protease
LFSTLTIFQIILVFGAIIFFHELGHLIMAKRAGILCREFAIGFGPKLFSFKRSETLYTIRLLPLGGYVRMAGEDHELIEIKTGHDVKLTLNAEGKVEKISLAQQQQEQQQILTDQKIINVRKVDLEQELFIEGYDAHDELVRYELDRQAIVQIQNQELQIAPRDRQFGGKTIGQRVATIFAGPLANFVLAFVLLFTYAWLIGPPTEVPKIGEVQPNSPAEQAGLQTGELVRSINGTPIQTWRDFVEIVSQSAGVQLTFEVEGVTGQTREVPITPIEANPEGFEGGERGIIGVSQMAERETFLSAIVYGAERTYEFAKLIFLALSMIFQGAFSIDDLAGPVGIVQITGQAAQNGLAVLLPFTALLSVNIGIFNLLPIPALDGGRLLFLVVEAVRRKPIDPQKEGLVHFIGFALLMLLILVVTWNDIQRIFFQP